MFGKLRNIAPLAMLGAFLQSPKGRAAIAKAKAYAADPNNRRRRWTPSTRSLGAADPRKKHLQATNFELGECPGPQVCRSPRYMAHFRPSKLRQMNRGFTP